MATEIFRVEKTRNYTVISNYHLRDDRISLKAKGLLSQMLSLSDEWEYSVRGLAQINREGVDAIREAIRELEKCGYIDRQQGRDARGRLTTNVYMIYEQPRRGRGEGAPPSGEDAGSSSGPSCRGHRWRENPSLVMPSSEKPVTEKPLMDKPLPENPMTDNPSTGNPLPENPTQLSTNVSSTNAPNTDSSSTDPSIHPSIHPLRLIHTGWKNQEGRIEDRSAPLPDLSPVNKQRLGIRRNIDYDALLPQYGAERLDEVVELILETLCARGTTLRVAGTEYPLGLVQDRLLRLNALHVQYVFSCIDEIQEQVRRVTGLSTTEAQIERALRGEQGSLAAGVQEAILAYGRQYAQRLIDALLESGFDVRATPAIFLGGGAGLIRRYVAASTFAHVAYLESIHANAMGYEYIAGKAERRERVG